MPTRLLLLALCCFGMGAQAMASAPRQPTSTATRIPPRAATTASLASAPATTVPWYAVEVLVFRSTADTTGRRETWPATVAAPDLARAVYPAAVATGPYAAVANHGVLIAHAARRLRAGGRYAPVATLGWKQPADAFDPVSFTPPPATLRATGFATSPLSAPVPPAVRLDGTARLRIVGDRAYVSLNLRLCEPTPPGLIIQAPPQATVTAGAASSLPAPETTSAPLPSPRQPGEQCFILKQRHQVQPRRLNYFDNPVFGALVTIRAVKPPEMPPARPRAAPAPARSPASG